jgi:ABC-type nitrate/sulfonate/bicarbonate transport system substrate-binding protein
MWLGAVFVLALWTFGFGQSLDAAQSIEKIKLAIPAKSMGYLPMYVAIHRGFMRDEGIELEIPNLRPNIAYSALLSGEVEYHGLAESGLRLAAKAANRIYFSISAPTRSAHKVCPQTLGRIFLGRTPCLP